MQENKNLTVFGVILGASIIISFAIASYTFYSLRSADYITTTGSAKMAVTSDTVKWTSTISRIVKLSTVKDGYAKMDTDLKEVKAFFVANGFVEKDLEISPIFMNEIYENNNTGANKNYNLIQNIEIQSTDVNKVDALSKNIGELINKGIIFNSMMPEYYYSKLPEARVALLENAVTDAKARAEKLAEAGNKKIGDLKSASSGVVQVLSPGSAAISDYGTYDTSKIEKEIMVTVKASFLIK
ncbi:MAG: SIMPL domain-containing protein [Candidatus Paceibacterota bacterium]|jgi:hypothetical protein